MRDELSILIDKKTGETELAAVRQHPASKGCSLASAGLPRA